MGKNQKKNSVQSKSHFQNHLINPLRSWVDFYFIDGQMVTILELITHKQKWNSIFCETKLQFFIMAKFNRKLIYCHSSCPKKQRHGVLEKEIKYPESYSVTYILQIKTSKKEKKKKKKKKILFLPHFFISYSKMRFVSLFNTTYFFP